MQQISGYLEIAGHSTRNTDGRRLNKTLRDLSTIKIGESSAQLVMVRADDAPVNVPDFGHNYACKCTNMGMFPRGVWRYFGLYFVVSSGALDVSDFGTYYVSEYARLVLCSISHTAEKNPLELKRIS
jgi:hypothetical protein